MASHRNSDTSMPESHAKLLQLTFDKFAANREWPKSRRLQIDFGPDDFWEVIRQIDFHLISNRGEKSQPDSQTVLSIEGMALCDGSDEYLALFIRALTACVEFYKENFENPTLTVSALQNLASMSKSESQCAIGLLFIGERIWSSASGSLAQQISELKLHPDILKYSAVTDFEQYLEIARQSRPQTSKDSYADVLRIELMDKILKSFFILDDRLAKRCENLFRNGHYSESVEAAFKVVRDRLRDLTGSERGQDAFKNGGLHIAGAAARNVDRDFNEAVKFMLMAIDNFRNERSHTSKIRIDDPVHAFEFLILCSLAMRFLDQAQVSRPDGMQEPNESEQSSA